MKNLTWMYKQYLKIKEMLFSNNLDILANIYGSDKAQGKIMYHGYTRYYSSLFLPLRKEKINVMEIGIGGHEDISKGGASLKMWYRFFPNANIFGIDIFSKKHLDNDRIKTFCGSQTDENFLKEVVKSTGSLDIIIDDGSHDPTHMLISFKTLFPFVKKGGYYIVEDTGCSYSPDWGGSKDLNSPSTFLNYSKKLTDNVNMQYLKELNIMADHDFNREEIEFIHYYKNLVIIKK